MAQLINSHGRPVIVKKIRPNDPCPCGSGKKAKNCCGVKKEYYYYKKKPK